MKGTELTHLQSQELEQIKIDSGLLRQDDLRKFTIQLQEFQNLIEKSPPKEWIVRHRDGYDYIPIDVLEAQVKKYFFGLFNWKIKDVKIIVNEILVYGDFEYFHPVAGVWLTVSGIGAAQIRMKKDAALDDINSKIKTALQMDAPHAESEAFKNAIQKIGRIFGRGLRREHQQTYKGFNIPDIENTLTSDQENIFEEAMININEFENPQELIKKKPEIIKSIKDAGINGKHLKEVEKAIQKKYDELHQG